MKLIIANNCSYKVLQMSCGERLKNELREAGYRVTPQRAVILETIAHMEGHHSAQEVYESARDRLPGLNIATVYRTLDTLHHAGFIDLFPSSTDTMLFAFHDDTNIHCHLHCVRCGQVFEIGIEPFRPLAAEIERVSDFKINLSHITLRGTCSDCLEQETLQE
jgi:Fur family ferric uptake transcriptional regulator